MLEIKQHAFKDVALLWKKESQGSLKYCEVNESKHLTYQDVPDGIAGKTEN